MKVLVTGAAGFIGMHVSKRLLDDGCDVIGLDNMNSYYEIELKNHRLAELTTYKNFRFCKLDLTDREGMAKIFAEEAFDSVIHLAAQAGVRYSIEAPFDYVDSNLVGMLTVLEGCRNNMVRHLTFASSSSVYGANQAVPFSENDQVDNPVSLYAATKKSCELMSYSYSKLYGIPITGLRFFTVYGPYGRPDMAPWLFTEAIINNNPIKIFNHGKMMRDFTFIDDVVEGVVRIHNQVPSNSVPYHLYNIGNSSPIELSRFITAVENACGSVAKKIFLDMQPGDVTQTFANISALEKAVGYKPAVEIEEGITHFVAWYKKYRKLSK